MNGTLVATAHPCTIRRRVITIANISLACEVRIMTSACDASTADKANTTTQMQSVPTISPAPIIQRIRLIAWHRAGVCRWRGFRHGLRQVTRRHRLALRIRLKLARPAFKRQRQWRLAKYAPKDYPTSIASNIASTRALCTATSTGVLPASSAPSANTSFWNTSKSQKQSPLVLRVARGC